MDSAIRLGFRLIRLTVSGQRYPPRFPPNPPTVGGQRQIPNLESFRLGFRLGLRLGIRLIALKKISEQKISEP